MRKIIICLILILFNLSSICLAFTYPTKETSEGHYDERFTIDIDKSLFPKGWDYNWLSYGGVLAISDYEDDNAPTASVDIFIDDAQKKGDFKAYVRKDSYVGEDKVLYYEPIELSIPKTGQKYKVIREFYDKEDKVTYRVISIFIETKEEYYQIRVVANKNEIDKYMPIFNHVVETFRIK